MQRNLQLGFRQLGGDKKIALNAVALSEKILQLLVAQPHMDMDGDMDWWWSEET